MSSAGQVSRMDRPELITASLDGETVETAVDLGGGDAVYCTPTRTLLYRADGLLSDESVEEFPHDVDRLDVVEGRRKTTVRLTDPERTREFTVPADHTDAVLEGLLGGILRAAGDIEPDEHVRAVYRFSELTLVLTDARLLRHVGSAVWGTDRETYPFADATGLSAEEGTHATQLVIEIDGRPQRLKLPADRAATVRRTVEEALFAYHDVDSRAEFDEAVGDVTAPSAAEEPSADALGAAVATGEEPSDQGGGAVPSFDIETPAEPAAAVEEPPAADIEARLAALEAAVERQADLIERQHDVLERLVEELRRGR